LQSLPIALRLGDYVLRPRQYSRGFRRFLFAAIPTSFLVLLILGPAKEAYCAYWPGQEKIFRHENRHSIASLAERPIVQQRIMRVASDTGWTDAVIYVGKKQVMRRMTSVYWVFLGVCTGFVILLFVWKPIERRYRRYRRRYRRRQQKATSRT